MNAAPYRRQGAVWLVDLLVQPRAARTELAGLHDGRLKLRLTAPPVDGAANAALVQFLAECLDLPRSALSVASGSTGRRKTVSIRAGCELAPRLAGLLGASS
ncbi:DUF167 domain-containing protein [Immundisolibacter cernigliae]|uniref:UPF0235 protein PG2T_08325 n=1 Tax=Immundisolibacter cernigliae TaxID=1810504 RepID=A0A1B1YTI8_9GAMM|nr:DUF167 family protein [Immundisolibacter cernigliae]ANX04180.1 hypothetical protein PG2T_08325 [Immundisolibacter cernigliae]